MPGNFKLSGLFLFFLYILQELFFFPPRALQELWGLFRLYPAGGMFCEILPCRAEVCARLII